jgi:hypothetical protein
MRFCRLRGAYLWITRLTWIWAISEPLNGARAAAIIASHDRQECPHTIVRLTCTV